MGVYRLEIPDWQPVSDNVWHRAWWTAAERKTQDAIMVGGYALALQIPRATGRRRVSVTLEYPDRRHWLDPSNAKKSCLDALVHAGLLVDDNQRYCECGLWQCVLGERKATVIQLEDLE